MQPILKEIEYKMDNAIKILEQDLVNVRTGRASTSILNGIMVDYYGNPTPLPQVGNVSAPDPQMLIIAPWEKSMLTAIEKSILQSDLGLMPQNDGSVIRIPIPPLNEERRKEMVKKIKKMGEDSKLSIRNVRRDGNEALKKKEKSKEISQDDEKVGLEKIQKITDEHIKKIEVIMIKKENELMEI